MSIPKIFIFIFILTFNIQAEIRYVSKTGNPEPPYLTWETACDSIQKTINICAAGDTIIVGPGVYNEAVVLIQGLTLLGSGIDSTIIDISGIPEDQHAIIMKHMCVVKFITMIVDRDYNGNTDVCLGALGDAPYIKDIGLLESCKMIDGIVGIASSYMMLDIKNCIIAESSGGFRLSANISGYYMTIENNVISSRDECVWMLYGPSPTFINNIFITRNSHAVLTGFSDTLRLYNNLVMTDFEPDGSGIGIGEYYMEAINNIVLGKFKRGIWATSSNNIVKNNYVSGAVSGIEGYAGQYPVVTHNNCWDNDYNYLNIPNLDSSNISEYPMFVNPDSGDYRLQMYSPMIDAGDPEIPDKDGSRSDIGLFGGPFGESYTYRDLPPLKPRHLTQSVDDSLVVFNWHRSFEADLCHYSIDIFYDEDSTQVTTSFDTTQFRDIIPKGTKVAKYYIGSVDKQGNVSERHEIKIILVGVEEEKKNNPEGYKLSHNYPNPFNPQTNIVFYSPDRARARLSIYNVNGELLEEIFNDEVEKGYYTVEYIPELKGETISSGVYLYILEIRKENRIVYSDMGKMIYLK